MTPDLASNHGHVLLEGLHGLVPDAEDAVLADGDDDVAVDTHHLPHLEHIIYDNKNTLRPGKMAATLTDEIFKCISLNENFRILNKISLKYMFLMV